MDAASQRDEAALRSDDVVRLQENQVDQATGKNDVLPKLADDITALQDTAALLKDALQDMQTDVARLQEQQQQQSAATEQRLATGKNDVLQNLVKITALQDLAATMSDALQKIQTDVAHLQEQQQQQHAAGQDQMARMNDGLQKVQVDVACLERQQQQERAATEQRERLRDLKLRRLKKKQDNNTAAIRDLRSYITTSLRKMHQELSIVILENASCWEKLAASIRNRQGDRREPEEEQ